jgi:hypothetical protein
MRVVGHENPLSSVSPPAYGYKVALSWEIVIMLQPIIGAWDSIADTG